MFPPPSTPAAVDAAPAKQQPRAQLEVLAVALALLLGGVGLVWYLNERDPNDGPSSNSPAASTEAVLTGGWFVSTT